MNEYFLCLNIIWIIFLCLNVRNCIWNYFRTWRIEVSICCHNEQLFFFFLNHSLVFHVSVWLYKRYCNFIWAAVACFKANSHQCIQSFDWNFDGKFHLHKLVINNFKYNYVHSDIKKWFILYSGIKKKKKSCSLWQQMLTSILHVLKVYLKLTCWNTLFFLFTLINSI
jgi:hypothetical protein